MLGHTKELASDCNQLGRRYESLRSTRLGDAGGVNDSTTAAQPSVADVAVGKQGKVSSAGGSAKRSLVGVPTWVIFLIVAGCWGMNTVAMRVVSRYAPPLSIATARAIVGGSLLVAISRAQKADWPSGKAEWGGIASIALFMTGLSTACMFLASKNAPAGVNSILSNTMPLFLAVLAPRFLSEKVTTRTILGLTIGLCGAALVAWRAIHGNIKPIGIAFGVAAAFGSAVGSIMYRRMPLPRLHRLMVVGMQLLLSSVVLGLLALPDDRSHMRFPWQFWLNFIYLAFIGLALSFVCFSELVQRVTGMQAGSAAYLSTFVGVLGGAVLLGEKLSPLVLLGGVVAIVGVAIVQSAPK
jgi:drug/metabolite transporter (DMT)-like permease